MKTSREFRVALCPVGTNAVKLIHFVHDGTWEFGVSFRRGKGRMFNTYTRYYLRDKNTGRSLWEGWPKGAPDPMDPSADAGVYEYLRSNPKRVIWIQRKIEAAIPAA